MLDNNLKGVDIDESTLSNIGGITWTTLDGTESVTTMSVSTSIWDRRVAVRAGHDEATEERFLVTAWCLG